MTSRLEFEFPIFLSFVGFVYCGQLGKRKSALNLMMIWARKKMTMAPICCTVACICLIRGRSLSSTSSSAGSSAVIYHLCPDHLVNCPHERASIHSNPSPCNMEGNRLVQSSRSLSARPLVGVSCRGSCRTLLFFSGPVELRISLNDLGCGTVHFGCRGLERSGTV